MIVRFRTSNGDIKDTKKTSHKTLSCLWICQELYTIINSPWHWPCNPQDYKDLLPTHGEQVYEHNHRWNTYSVMNFNRSQRLVWFHRKINPFSCSKGEWISPCISHWTLFVSHVLDFSYSLPNRSLTGMTYALIRKQRTARQIVSDFTIKVVRWWEIPNLK